MRLNFLDTLRPELWCIDGLARHLEPMPGRRYGLHLVESLPRIPVQFESLPLNNTAWVLYVQVNPDQEPFDDTYFLKKVRDHIGFGSSRNIDVTILPGMQHTLSIEPAPDNDDESPTPRRGLSEAKRSAYQYFTPPADLSRPPPIMNFNKLIQ